MDLHRDLRGNAAEHVTEAVADGLADIHEGAWDTLELFANFRKNLLTVTAAFVELDIELVDGDRHDVVVPLGASGAASDGFDFRNFQQQFDRAAADLIRLF